MYLWLLFKIVIVTIESFVTPVYELFNTLFKGCYCQLIEDCHNAVSKLSDCWTHCRPIHFFSSGENRSFLFNLAAYCNSLGHLRITSKTKSNACWPLLIHAHSAGATQWLLQQFKWYVFVWPLKYPTLFLVTSNFSK